MTYDLSGGRKKFLIANSPLQPPVKQIDYQVLFNI